MVVSFVFGLLLLDNCRFQSAQPVLVRERLDQTLDPAIAHCGGKSPAIGRDQASPVTAFSSASGATSWAREIGAASADISTSADPEKIFGMLFP
jgi:hypothetical protein